MGNTSELARVVTERMLGAPATEFVDVADPRDRLQLVHEFLTFYGPLDRATIGELLPLPMPDLDIVLAELVDADLLVAGHLLAANDTIHYCDADNLEILLRMQRAARRDPLAPRAITQMPEFLAAWQHFGGATTAVALGDTLDRLRGYNADVEVWLNDLVDARHPEPRHASVGRSAWCRCVRVARPRPRSDQRHACRRSCLLDPTSSPSTSADFADAFKGSQRTYGFFQLADAAGQSLAPSATFCGTACGRAARVPIRSRRCAPATFVNIGSIRWRPRNPQAPSKPRAAPRAGSNVGWPGSWFLLPEHDDNDSDPLAALETAKDRARILLDRYGVICRELANREGGVFRWAALFAHCAS